MRYHTGNSGHVQANYDNCSSDTRWRPHWASVWPTRTHAQSGSSSALVASSQAASAAYQTTMNHCISINYSVQYIQVLHISKISKPGWECSRNLQWRCQCPRSVQSVPQSRLDPVEQSEWASMIIRSIRLVDKSKTPIHVLTNCISTMKVFSAYLRAATTSCSAHTHTQDDTAATIGQKPRTVRTMFQNCGFVEPAASTSSTSSFCTIELELEQRLEQTSNPRHA